MRLALAGAVTIVLASSGTADAQFRDWRASADLDIDSDYLHATRPSAAEERDGQATFGLALRATVGKNPVQLGLGFGYRLGASLPGGFVYAVELLPLGVGVVLSDRFRFVVRGGAGFSGVTSRVPFSGDFPIEARLDSRLTKWLAFGAFARISWLTSAARDDGVRVIGFGDELRAGVRLRVNKHYNHGSRMRGNDGYYFAALIQESLGSRFYGGAFGYTMDFAAGR